MKNEVFHVEGMSCQHCVQAIEGGLKKINVVANVDLANKTVTVEYDENRVTAKQIKDVIDDLGYDVVQSEVVSQG